MPRLPTWGLRGALLALAALGLLAAGCTARQINNPQGWAGVAVTPDALYAATRQGRVLMLDPSPALGANANRVVAQFPPQQDDRLDALYSTPVLEGDTVYITTFAKKKNAALVALDASTLEDKWTFFEFTPPLGGERKRLGRIVNNIAVHNGTILLGSLDHKVYALNADGSLKWNRLYDAGAEVWSVPVVYKDRVYVGAANGKLVALSLETGEPVPTFSFKANGALNAEPVIQDGTIYVAAFDKRVYAVDAETGAKKWEFAAGNWFWSRPIVQDGVVYAAGMDGFVYALDAQTGTLQWQFKLGAPVRSDPVLVGDTLVIASAKKGDLSGRIWALDLKTGSRRWDFNAQDSVIAPLATDGQVVYFTNTKGVIVALDATQRGKELWRHQP